MSYYVPPTELIELLISKWCTKKEIRDLLSSLGQKPLMAKVLRALDNYNLAMSDDGFYKIITTDDFNV